MKTKTFLLLALGLSAAIPAALPTSGQAQLSRMGQSQKDERAVKLLNDFLKALVDNKDDMDAAVIAALPMLQKSLKDDRGKDVTRDLRNFSFKKAWQNAGLYARPVQITRVRMTSISAVGFGKTAEKGKVADYFVAKAEGQPGLPAPVKIFFPEGNGDPKIFYVGSL